MTPIPGLPESAARSTGTEDYFEMDWEIGTLDILLSTKRAKKPTHLLRILAAAVKKET